MGDKLVSVSWSPKGAGVLLLNGVPTSPGTVLNVILFGGFLKSMWQSRNKQHDIYFNTIFIQHSYLLHHTMSLYCMERDDRDNRVEETLKCSSSGTTQTDLLLALRPIWNQHFCKKTQLWISNPCFHICNLCLEISAVIQCFLNTFDLNHTFRDVFFHVVWFDR